MTELYLIYYYQNISLQRIKMTLRERMRQEKSKGKNKWRQGNRSTAEKKTSVF